MEATRRSRFDRKPPLKNGKRRGVLVTPRDIEQVFPLLARYRYLSSNWIHAFVGGDYQSLTKHLNLLYRHGYLNRPDQQRKNANAYYRHVIYELDQKGADILRSRGIDLTLKDYRTHFDHKYLECLVEASVEIGARESGLSLIRWPEIVSSPQFPKRDSKDPMTIPVGERTVRPDGAFVIGYPDGFRFIVYEADCDTESGDSDYANSIRSKIENYLAVIKDKLYATYYGSSTFTVLFVTINERRANEIVRLVERVISGHGYPKEYAKRFAVQWTPIYNSFERPEPPGGFILTKPCKRTGFPDLYLDQT